MGGVAAQGSGLWPRQWHAAGAAAGELLRADRPRHGSLGGRHPALQVRCCNLHCGCHQSDQVQSNWRKARLGPFPHASHCPPAQHEVSFRNYQPHQHYDVLFSTGACGWTPGRAAGRTPTGPRPMSRAWRTLSMRRTTRGAPSCGSPFPVWRPSLRAPQTRCTASRPPAVTIPLPGWLLPGTHAAVQTSEACCISTLFNARTWLPY